MDGSVKTGEKLVDAALHHFTLCVVAARGGRDAIAVALERTAHGSAVAVAHTELNRHFTRGENVACDVEIHSITEGSNPAASVTDTSGAQGANAGMPWSRKTTITWKDRKSMMLMAKEHVIRNKFFFPDRA